MTAGAGAVRTAVLLAAVLCPPSARALDLALPPSASVTAESDSAPDSFSVPVAPFTDGALPVTEAEGRVIRRAWRVRSRALTTLQLLSPLRAQLIDAGYVPVLECSDRDCGGFDFRYALEVIEAPAMHVDLFDFRILTARRDTATGTSWATLLVSRTEGSGYVQLVLVTPDGEETELSVTRDAPPVAGALSGTPRTAPGSLAERLDNNGHAILGDLVFDTGSSQLSDGTYASLAALADYLNADPTRRVALVGHTDTEGSLDGNIALSRRRAQSVLDRLVDRHGVARGQLSAGGMGYLSPVASNLTTEGRDRNRRVEAVLLNTEPSGSE